MGQLRHDRRAGTPRPPCQDSLDLISFATSSLRAGNCVWVLCLVGLHWLREREASAVSKGEWIGQAAVGLLVTALIVGGMQQHSSAQQSLPETPSVSPPSLIIIKPTGYQPKTGSSDSEQGEAAFKELNCLACHSVRGVGGTMGPVLDAVGQRRSEEFLMARLADSSEQRKKFAALVGSREGDLRPHNRVSVRTAQLLVDFLLTLPEPPGGFVVVPHVTRLPAEAPISNPDFRPARQTESSERGRTLYYDRGCVACHSIAKIGGWLGPSLDGVGGRRSRDFIVAHVSNARVHAEIAAEPHERSSQMPQLNLSSGQVQQIADFLMTLPNTR